MRVNEDKKTPRKRSEMFKLTFFLVWIDREIEIFIFISISLSLDKSASLLVIFSWLTLLP